MKKYLVLGQYFNWKCLWSVP